jgi:hypothetical protein
MDEIILAVLIALFAGFALVDIIRFVQSLERGTVWTFLFGIGLPCILVAYLLVQAGFLGIGSNAAPFKRSAASERRCAELRDANCFWEP